MRAILLTIPVVAGLFLAMTAAESDETQAADATVAAASKVDEPDKAAETDEAKEKDEFKVPPGFRVKTRGKHTLYCRSEPVMGTNFKSVKCYDEAGIREMLQAQREDQRRVDQMRRICSQTGACGGT